VNIQTQITRISSNGIWLLARNEELFLSYEDFPWFLDKPVKSIMKVEEPTEGNFYWPDLDVDLSLKIIKNPGYFPLKIK
jgi:hypothetical protein